MPMLASAEPRMLPSASAGRCWMSEAMTMASWREGRQAVRSARGGPGVRWLLVQHKPNRRRDWRRAAPLQNMPSALQHLTSTHLLPLGAGGEQRDERLVDAGAARHGGQRAQQLLSRVRQRHDAAHEHADGKDERRGERARAGAAAALAEVSRTRRHGCGCGVGIGAGSKGRAKWRDTRGRAAGLTLERGLARAHVAARAVGCGCARAADVSTRRAPSGPLPPAPSP